MKHFFFLQCFEVLEKLGEGSFGEVGRTVCQCHGLDVSSVSSMITNFNPTRIGK